MHPSRNREKSLVGCHFTPLYLIDNVPITKKNFTLSFLSEPISKTIIKKTLKKAFLTKQLVLQSTGFTIQAIGKLIRLSGKPFNLLGKRSVGNEDLLDEISKYDQDDCVKFFICNIAEDRNDSLGEMETNILNYFDVDISEQTLNPYSSRSAYQVAAYLGGLQEAHLCEKVYTRCQLSFKELRSYITSNNS